MLPTKYFSAHHKAPYILTNILHPPPYHIFRWPNWSLQLQSTPCLFKWGWKPNLPYKKALKLTYVYLVQVRQYHEVLKLNLHTINQIPSDSNSLLIVFGIWGVVHCKFISQPNCWWLARFWGVWDKTFSKNWLKCYTRPTVYYTTKMYSHWAHIICVSCHNSMAIHLHLLHLPDLCDFLLKMRVQLKWSHFDMSNRFSMNLQCLSCFM